MGEDNKIQFKKCPVCNEKNNPAFELCWKCGSSFATGKVTARKKVQSAIASSFDWWGILKVTFWIIWTLIVIWSLIDDRFNSKLGLGLICAGLFVLFTSSFKDAIEEGMKQALRDYFVRDDLKSMIREAIFGYAKEDLSETIKDALNDSELYEDLKLTIKDAVVEALDETREKAE